MAEPEIHFDDQGSKGRYYTRPDPNGQEAELTFSRAGETMVIIDHTDVPEVYRGQGVGVKLVEYAVAEARKSGLKVLPLCPFAAAQFRNHPDWADVLKG